MFNDAIFSAEAVKHHLAKQGERASEENNKLTGGIGESEELTI